MRKTGSIALLSGIFLWGVCASAQDESEGGRWVTYKSDPDSSDVYQIDRNSIRQEGAYTTYWVRIWDDFAKKPLTFGYDVTAATKWVANCATRKVGTTYTDTNDPVFSKGIKSLSAMTWEKLDNPEIRKIVCAIK